MIKNIRKPWGSEEILHADNHYILKRINIKKGKKLSLQYHIYKTETLYLIKGKATVYLCSPSIWAINEEFERRLDPMDFEVGSYITVEPGWIHRLEAIEDCTFLEASTIELWDVVRLEDDFGRI